MSHGKGQIALQKCTPLPLRLCWIAVALLAVPSAASAWHDTIEGGLQSSGGGVPLDVILPIAIAVIVGGVALAIWGRKTEKPHRRRRPRR